MQIKKHAYACTGIFLALFFSVSSFAQERVGSVQGIVTDPSGAAIVSAAVEIRGTNLKQSTITNDGGGYVFNAVPPGTYTLLFRASGFRTFEQKNIIVSLGRVHIVNAKLAILDRTVSITVVSDEAPPIDTGSTVVAKNVTPELYDRFPKGRSFEGLVIMAPGVRFEPKQGAGPQVDGSSGSENVYFIDGVETTHPQFGTLTRMSSFPFQWVYEMQMKSSGFDAQYGGATGGVINAVTKSGTNALHGRVSLYTSVDGVNAGPQSTLRLKPFNDDIAEYFHNTRDGYRLVNPGYEVGGPIKKDRVWFYSSSYPMFQEFNRDVTFLLNNQTGAYKSRTRQDFSLNKVDFQQPLAGKYLRGSFSHTYSPFKVNGILPSQQGTDAPTTPFADRGFRAPSSGYSWHVDFTPSHDLVLNAFGGYKYQNVKDYGVSRGTRYRFANANTNLPPTLPVPEHLKGPAGNFTPDNRQTIQDIYTRNNVNASVALHRSWHGQHDIRAGYQLNRIHNEPVANTWPDGYVFTFWNRAWRGITVPGVHRGTYGHYINRVFATTGNVSNKNQGIFLQDTWRVHRTVSFSLGIRTEHEFVPSFRTDSGIPSKAFTFGFADKIAPRIGVAYDPSGKGRTKLFGAFGLYYDTMKYEMPRGSFGGDQWKDYVYTLNDPNFLAIKPNSMPNSNTGTFTGRLIETIDWRIPSNSPGNYLIEPYLKPMRVRVYDLGVEQELKTGWIGSLRYTRRQLDRTIEDVGVLTEFGEQYFIANPGFGLTVDPKNFPADFPPSVTPKAERVYDGLEFALNKRFSRYMVSASHTFSRLRGNYGGLASSDEDGRMSPNVNRYFDLPWMSYDAMGKRVYGRLATDRPHTFKLFASYDVPSRLGVTRVSPVFFAYSGTPLTTEVDVVSHTPVFVNGRGDMGRTPAFTQTDFLFSHEFRVRALKMRESQRVRVEAEVSNSFNHGRPLNASPTYLHPNDGQIQFENPGEVFKGYDYKTLRKNQGLRVDPRYGLVSAFQSPRSVRFGAHFIF